MGSLFAYREFFGQLIGLAAELFDVDIFEGQDANGLYEAVGAVNVPNPYVLHVQLKVEVGCCVDPV